VINLVDRTYGHKIIYTFLTTVPLRNDAGWCNECVVKRISKVSGVGCQCTEDPSSPDGFAAAGREQKTED